MDVFSRMYDGKGLANDATQRSRRFSTDPYIPIRRPFKKGCECSRQAATENRLHNPSIRGHRFRTLVLCVGRSADKLCDDCSHATDMNRERPTGRKYTGPSTPEGVVGSPLGRHLLTVKTDSLVSGGRRSLRPVNRTLERGAEFIDRPVWRQIPSD